METVMNRRNLLKLAACSALPSGLLRAHSALAADEAIELAYLIPMSGPFATDAKIIDMGLKLAVEQQGTVLGRRVRASTFDTEGKPGTAVRKLQEAAQKPSMRFFAGGALSSEALAMGKEAERLGAVFATAAGADEITGKDCNRATFRWSVPTYGAIERTVRPLIEAMPKAKRWYTITPQYVFGDGLLSAAKAVFAEKGVEHVGNSYHSLSQKEFSGYLTNALAAKPDVLLLLNYAQQSTDALRQAVSFGMKEKMTILVAWSSGLEQMQALGPDICNGVYFGAQYWHTVATPRNQDLVRRAKAGGMTPNYNMVAGYATARLLLDGIIKAGNADPKAVAAAIAGMQYDGVTGPETVRAADHQVIKDYYLLKGKPKASMRDADDFVDIVSAGKAFLPPDKTMCRMA